MTPTDLFNKYLWLVELLSHGRQFSKAEIDAYWKVSEFGDGKHGIPRRTFIRMKEAIFDLFDLQIEYSRGNDKYYIEEGFTERHKRTRQFLLEAFAVSHLLRENKDLDERIILENVAAGSNQFLPEITAAMRENHRLAITYQSYDMLTAREFEIEPFALRYFGHRWYVLARTDFHNSLYLYALDRMKAVEVTNKTFKLPADFSAQEHFSRYFGVMTTEGKMETICLKTTELRAKYLRSLPLHHSQKETTPNCFEFRLVPTPDFLNALRAMGTGVEVLRPAWLRKQLLEEAKELVTKYENN
ncbi:MAG: WYL domain-containing protein [Bacteroidales bacterium]|nr:WYL domain-containing protein [Bacteroidales bacterium]